MNLRRGRRLAFRARTIGVLLGASLLVSCSPAAELVDRILWAWGEEEVARPLLAELGEARVAANREDHVSVRTVEVAGRERAALWAHAPAEIVFENVEIPAEARLELGVGISEAVRGKGGDGVRFVVLARTDQGDAVLWERHVPPPDPGGSAGWIDTEIPLDAWEDRTVALVLRTEPGADRAFDHSAWAHPVLVGRPDAPPSLRLEEMIESFEAADDVRVQVGAGRHLAGRVFVERAQPPAASGEGVPFRIALGGETLWTREVGAELGMARVPFSVDLGQYGAGEREVSFRIERSSNPGSGAEAGWERLRLVASEVRRRQPRRSGRNVLFILVDTLRADHVGLYGHERNTTPTLDALAEEAAIFEMAISQSSWTMPATASILTGLHPLEHGVTGDAGIGPEVVTLAEHFRRRGISTFGISTNPLVGREEGFARGFEDFIQFDWGRADAVNEVLVDMLRGRESARWFGYVHYSDPHDPYDAPEPYGSMFQGDATSRYAERSAFQNLVRAVNFSVGTASMDSEDVEYLKAAYDGEIRYWDEHLKHLLEAMDGMGLLEDTLIVVTSDHGEEFLEHGRLKHGLQLYAESVRVPLIVHGPGVEKGRYEEPVETRRLYDLLVHGLGPGGNDAIPVGDLLAAEEGRVFSHTSHGVVDGRRERAELAAVRDRRFKLIRYLDPADPERVELYDLAGDEGENVDLAGDASGPLDRLDQALGEWIREGSGADGADEEHDPEILEKLRALGYIQ